MLATSSNNDSDPDSIADGLSDQQNRRELRALAEACDRNKLRRERNKLRKEGQKEEEKVFDNITGIAFDGRRDSTFKISEVNGKYCTSTILEDQCVITGEPDDFYHDHFSP